MTLRFKKPGSKGPGTTGKPRGGKNKWKPADLQTGVLSDLLNNFRQAHGQSLRELYISSQVAAPLCQNNVDSVLAPMAALVEQEIMARKTEGQAALDELNQLLAQQDLAQEKLNELREEIWPPSKKTEALALPEPQQARALPEPTKQKLNTKDQRESQNSADNGTGSDLQYLDNAPKEMAAK